jgi:predicted small lipoprotein YifL
VTAACARVYCGLLLLCSNLRLSIIGERKKEPIMKIFAALLVFSCLALTGCGQTGPLYLPQPEQPAEESAPQ